jgi:hypothetical protein
MDAAVGLVFIAFRQKAIEKQGQGSSYEQMPCKRNKSDKLLAVCNLALLLHRAFVNTYLPFLSLLSGSG